MPNFTPIYQVIIPFRDRGKDPLRAENLARVLDMWEERGFTPWVCSDGRMGSQQFNRSAAYNRGMEHCSDEVDGFVFAESDMLISLDQVREAIDLAELSPGLVVPFTTYVGLGPLESEGVRAHRMEPSFIKPDKVMRNGSSIGAINVVSRETMKLVGQWDERFEGNWYDDDAMKIAFDICTGRPTRYVEGTAYHLWHLPGHRGEHLGPDDIAATAANKRRLGHYHFAARARNVDRIRALTGGAS